MNQLNSIIIEGNLTKEPEVKDTANGFKVAVLPVAVNRFYKNANGEGVNEVSYFTVETFGKLAEACVERCSKGQGVRIVGRLKQSRWVSTDGKKASKVTIIAEHVEFKTRVTKSSDKEQNPEAEMQEMQAANEAACAEDVNMSEESLVF